jgi:hypothetical protein
MAELPSPVAPQRLHPDQLSGDGGWRGCWPQRTAVEAARNGSRRSADKKTMSTLVEAGMAAHIAE